MKYRNPEGRWQSQSCSTSKEARRVKAEIETSIARGAYIDVTRGQVLAGEWADRWLRTKGNLSPSTRAGYEGILKLQVKPRWGDVPLAKIGHADVQEWVAELVDDGLAPASVQKVHRVMSMMLGLAVKDDRLTRNVAEEITLPEPDEMPHGVDARCRSPTS